MVIPPNNDLTSNTSTHSRHKANSVAAANNSTSSKSAPSVNNHTDEVKLSQAAHTFERLESKINESSGTDAAKIDLIKQKIADGSYEISSERIAEGLLKQDAI